MTLIACDECGAEISDKAAACVKCGAPTPAAQAVGSDRGVVTTQQTGKEFKVIQAIGVVLILAGAVSCSAREAGAAAGLWVVGFAVFMFARIGAWWRHG